MKPFAALARAKAEQYRPVSLEHLRNLIDGPAQPIALDIQREPEQTVLKPLLPGFTTTQTAEPSL